ncbi:MAG TPA: hypothetical protein VNO81_02895 [Candidatus Nitrosotenuis sp.]|nr:hypothetical protein [Candidatus Nitrosotenuis sp.]
MRKALLLLLLALGLALALPAGAQQHPGGGAGQSQHAAGFEEQGHLPVQVYYWRAFLLQPWRNRASVRRILVQTGVLAGLTVALWLWLRRWRLSG